MNTEQMYDIARRVAYRVRIELGLVWTYEDKRDAEQTAILGVVKALKYSPGKGEGYYYRAARREILCWLFRSWNKQPSRQVPVILAEEVTINNDMADSWERELTEEEKQIIWKIIYESRKKKGIRGSNATTRDVTILYRLSCGWAHSDIAQELNIPVADVHTYRKSLRKRLTEIVSNL